MSNCTGELIRVGDGFGPEVVVSFIANATIAISALLFGYVTNALNVQQLNYLDRRNIAWLQAKCTALEGCLQSLKERIWPDPDGLARRPSALSTASREDLNQLSAVRRDAISRFILALSDTQLVTGLAILIAGVFVRRGIKIYELHIVLAQAWLSSTTHLATLDALRNDLRSYGLVRDVRVACMMLLLTLLTAAFMMCQVDWHWRTPVMSIAQYDDSLNWTSKGVHWFVNNLAWVAALLLIFGNYVIRIQDLYVNQRHSLYILSSLVWRCRSHPSNESSHQQFFAKRIEALRSRRMARTLRTHGPIGFISLAIHGYDGSFLSSIPGIFFCFLYGVTWNYNIFYRVPKEKSLCVTTGRMGFGQIMPLLLLLLPILAAGQTYYEYRNRLIETLHGIEARQQSEVSVANQQLGSLDGEDIEADPAVAPANYFFLLHVAVMSSIAVVINVGWMGSSDSMFVGCCIFLGVLGLECLWIAFEVIDFIKTPKPNAAEKERTWYRELDTSASSEMELGLMPESSSELTRRNETKS